MTLIVCPLSRIHDLIDSRAPSHLLTLLGPTEMIEEHPRMAGRHLRLGIHDIVEPIGGLVAPSEATVSSILEFGRGWTGERPMLVHCWAGISRSSAAAFILACDRNPEVDEALIARHIRKTSVIAHPNARLVALADAVMGRGGRMIAAIEGIGPGRPAVENMPFDVPIPFGP